MACTFYIHCDFGLFGLIRTTELTPCTCTVYYMYVRWPVVHLPLGQILPDVLHAKVLIDLEMNVRQGCLLPLGTWSNLWSVFVPFDLWSLFPTGLMRSIIVMYAILWYSRNWCAGLILDCDLHEKYSTLFLKNTWLWELEKKWLFINTLYNRAQNYILETK
jgi:hypothetical protein